MSGTNTTNSQLTNDTKEIIVQDTIATSAAASSNQNRPLSPIRPSNGKMSPVRIHHTGPSLGSLPGHPPLSPARRPLTTYTTSMGPPFQAQPRNRSQSLGSTPLGWKNGHFPSYPTAADLLPVTAAGSAGAFLAPCLPMMCPPEPSITQKAMEHASTLERERAKKLEQDELNMTADELRAVLKKERHRMARFAADLASLKSTAVQSQLEAEVVEEGRINGLMRRMDHLQQEKGRIIVELEREEEMLTNTLQKKLNEVRREKAQLEQQIEREKTSHILLQTQLSDLRNEHLSIAEHLEEEEEMEEE